MYSAVNAGLRLASTVRPSVPGSEKPCGSQEHSKFPVQGDVGFFSSFPTRSVVGVRLASAVKREKRKALRPEGCQTLDKPRATTITKFARSAAHTETRLDGSWKRQDRGLSSARALAAASATRVGNTHKVSTEGKEDVRLTFSISTCSWVSGTRLAMSASVSPSTNANFKIVKPVQRAHKICCLLQNVFFEKTNF